MVAEPVALTPCPSPIVPGTARGRGEQPANLAAWVWRATRRWPRPQAPTCLYIDSYVSYWILSRDWHGLCCARGQLSRGAAGCGGNKLWPISRIADRYGPLLFDNSILFCQAQPGRPRQPPRPGHCAPTHSSRKIDDRKINCPCSRPVGELSRPAKAGTPALMHFPVTCVLTGNLPAITTAEGTTGKNKIS